MAIVRLRPADLRRAIADGMLSLQGLADAYWYLHRQERTTWTHELDLRPYKESF